jgi:hypothetical protein
MSDTQHQEPIIFAAGDSLIFKRHFDKFPANNGWSLEYSLFSLNGVSANLAIDSAPDPCNTYDHLVSIQNFAAATPPGEYKLIGYAVNTVNNVTTDRRQIYEGRFILTPNFALQKSTAPLTTHTQRTITILEAQIEQLSQVVLQESDVQRSRFVWKKLEEFQQMLKEYREKRFNEIKIEAVRNGRNAGDQIRPVFGIV